MAQKTFTELMSGYVHNRLTQDELRQFLQLLEQEESKSDLQAGIKSLFDNQSISGLADQDKAATVFENIMMAAGEAKSLENERWLYPTPSTRVFTMRRALVAASILLLIGVGWVFFAGQKEKTAVATNSRKDLDNIGFALHHEVNTTGKEKQIRLPDGSLITLADKSEIIYPELFVKRDIQLTGKAYFKVAKDKNRPFTVTTSEISTTALGTEFTVTAVKFTNQIIVRLYEGKVVVKAVDTANRRMKKNVFLLPGQQFIYGNQTTARVMTFQVKRKAPNQILKEEIFRDYPSISENVEAPYVMFNNQQLGSVLDDLAALYNTKIVYRKRDIENIYFIGKYYQSETLENILKRIGTLNNLTITKKDTAFVISK